MKRDTVIYDSLGDRPLPKWLIDQREGLNRYQPEKAEMKKDYSLQISLVSTGAAVLLIVILLTLYFFYKIKNKNIT